MPLPTAADLINSLNSNTQMKQHLGNLADYVAMISDQAKRQDSRFYHIPSGNTVIAETNPALFAVELTVSAGEQYIVNTQSLTGSVAGKLYIVDANNNALFKIESTEISDQPYVLTIPANGKKLFVNCVKEFAPNFSVAKVQKSLLDLVYDQQNKKQFSYFSNNNSVITIESNAGLFAIELEVQENEYVLIDTQTFGVAKQYYVVDGQNNIIAHMEPGGYGYPYVLNIPANAKKLCVNCAYSYSKKFSVKKIPSSIVNMFSAGNKRKDFTFYYSTDNQKLIRETNSGLFSVELDVEYGQHYLIDTKGFGVAGERYITDALGNILDFKASNGNANGEQLVKIPENGSKLYVNCSYEYKEHFFVERIAKQVAEAINPLATETLISTFFSINGQSIQKNSHPDFTAYILSVNTGQSIDIQTKTYGIAPSYCLVDENEVLVDFRPSSLDVQNFTLTVPDGAVKLYVNCEISSLSILKIELSKNIQPVKDVKTFFPKISYPGILQQKCPNFYTKFKEKNQDVTVVLTGTSLTQGNFEYTSEREDASMRPAALHTHDLASSIFDVLVKHWDGQKYRRYDHSDLSFSDSNWTVVNQLPDYIWDDYAHIKNGLTKTTTDPNASVSMTIPANAWQFNFVYRSDASSGDCTISIAEGSGKVEVFNGSEWVEANGATFTMYEPPATDTKGNTQYQKRLKMRCKNKDAGGINSIGSTKQISISKGNNANRFNVVGFEWSQREFMLSVINGARGGFEWGDPSGNRLDKYQDTDIWAFNPDLLLAEITIINWGASEVTALSKDPLHFVNIAKRAYFNEFNDMQTSLYAKSEAYSKCDVIFYSDTLAASSAVAGAWDSSTHEPKFGTVVEAATNGGAVDTSNVGRVKTNFENYEAVESYIASKDYLFIPVLSTFKSVTEGFYGSYWAGMQPSGKVGDTLTVDGVHFNDNGAKLFASLICPIFENI